MDEESKSETKRNETSSEEKASKGDEREKKRGEHKAEGTQKA